MRLSVSFRSLIFLLNAAERMSLEIKKIAATSGPAVNRRVVTCWPGRRAWMRGEGAFTGMLQRPSPIARRNKTRAPHSGDFLAGSPGRQGGGD